LHFQSPYCHSTNKTMGLDIKTIREVVALVLRVWREAAGLFLSIELWLMVLGCRRHRRRRMAGGHGRRPQPAGQWFMQ
jgi:hypothetical protein